MLLLWTFLHQLRSAIWLLVVVVCLGPAGIGAHAAPSPIASSCGSACPCQEESTDHSATDSDFLAQAPHGSECAGGRGTAPDGAADSSGGCEVERESDCPEDCPSCKSGVGFGLAVLPRGLPRMVLLSTAAGLLAPLEAAAPGSDRALFRPPRHLLAEFS